jgi:hypothetical protein
VDIFCPINLRKYVISLYISPISLLTYSLKSDIIDSWLKIQEILPNQGGEEDGGEK